jgi:hypothetical protein
MFPDVTLDRERDIVARPGRSTLRCSISNDPTAAKG